jgi:AcrR family transcriptional regulator
MATRQTDKRDRLIQTAVQLVYQQGFHHTTLADLAQQAQV